MARLAQQLHRLTRDTRGAALLEMGFVAPILVVLAFGTADIGFGFVRQLKVQQAAARAIELATASGLINNLSTTIQSEAASAAGVPQSQVTVDMWLECDGVRQSDFNGTCSASSPSRFAAVTITDSYVSMFSSLFNKGSSSTTIPLRGFAEVRVQ